MIVFPYFTKVALGGYFPTSESRPRLRAEIYNLTFFICITSEPSSWIYGVLRTVKAMIDFRRSFLDDYREHTSPRSSGSLWILFIHSLGIVI